MLLDILRQKLIDILYKDVSAIRLSLSWSALTLMVGFFYGSTDTDNYNFLHALMCYTYWAMVFGVYGIAMFFTAVSKIPRYTHCAIDFVGLWLWTYLFLSFVVASSEPVTSAEFLLIVPILSSIWIITDRLFKLYIYKQLDLK